jgi:amino acid transporter
VATVMSCLVIGILSAAEVYIAQLVWPASRPFPDQDTAYVYAAALTWAPLFKIVGFTLLVANFGSGMGAQIGAARLLYGMGRSNALPKSFFGVVDAKHHIPRNNVVFIGVIVLVGSFFLTYGRGIELLNFGALIAFMGVNLSAFMRYFVHEGKRTVTNFVPPIAGFLICGWMWWNLSLPARILGSIWMAAGIAFGIWKTRWFRMPLSFEMPAE